MSETQNITAVYLIDNQYVCFDENFGWFAINADYARNHPLLLNFLDNLASGNITN